MASRGVRGLDLRMRWVASNLVEATAIRKKLIPGQCLDTIATAEGQAKQKSKEVRKKPKWLLLPIVEHQADAYPIGKFVDGEVDAFLVVHWLWHAVPHHSSPLWPTMNDPLTLHG